MTNTATKTQNGIKVTVEYRKEVVYVDRNLKLGASTHDFVYMTIEVCGKKITNDDLGFFHTVDYKLNKGMDPKAYGRFGNTYLQKSTYDLVASVLAEAKQGCEESEEYAEVLKKEEASAEKSRQDDEKYEQSINSRKKHTGWCDKCQSYCYGDCESN